MLLVAHHDAPTHATKNTLRSILIGPHLQADAVEFDVRATRDVAVAVHTENARQTRATGATAIISSDFEGIAAGLEKRS